MDPGTEAVFQYFLAPYQQQLERLQQENAGLHQMMSLSAAASRTARGPKIPAPSFFYGTKGVVPDDEKVSFESWSGQVRTYISLRQMEFPDERTKCAFAASYLRGSADEWVRPYTSALHKNEPVPIFDSLTTFFDSLAAAFGEADTVTAAENEILNLKQSGTVSEYAAKFRALKVKTQWEMDKKPWIAIFRHGLSNRFRTDLTLKKMPTEFDEYVKAACLYDDELRSLRSANRTNNAFIPRTGTVSHSRPQPSPNQNRTTSNRDPNAMEVDQIDRDEALRKGLCFHCGEKGHISFKCPKRTKANPSNRTNVNAAATPSTAPVTPTASISDTTDETPNGSNRTDGTTERLISVEEAAKVLMAHLSKGQGFN